MRVHSLDALPHLGPPSVHLESVVPADPPSLPRLRVVAAIAARGRRDASPPPIPIQRSSALPPPPRALRWRFAGALAECARTKRRFVDHCATKELPTRILKDESNMSRTLFDGKRIEHDTTDANISCAMLHEATTVLASVLLPAPLRPSHATAAPVEMLNEKSVNTSRPR